ncbi:hypothetical protein GR157_11330 [Burkholderia sp. 4701]|nr:hypothetical protein [Burkholderia sp. 4701]MXN82483.1 hypothetical protein [Burkholderia sp. 4812]
MSIRVMTGIKRELAETIGRYFDAHGMPFEIEERPADALRVGFRIDGHPAVVTVTFDRDAFASFDGWDAPRKRGAFARIAAEFAEMMARRGPSAYAGDFHINRF